MSEHLDTQNFPILFTGLFLLLASVVIFYRSKKYGILTLVIASGVLAYFMADLDPFLNLWDEQQHALVAKHMAQHPFYPTLYEYPILDYNYQNWANNHVWIHKQPLFLWQMALSIKIFGVNALAVRLPSVLLHALLTLVVFRIGSIVKNEKVGFIAAVIITVANFPLELVAGRLPTDHNDMSFLFYVSWSFLCWLEYERSRSKKWLILLGISAGAAVLVKWLMGLLVYVCWAVVITVKLKFKVWKISNYFDLLKAFAISLIIFLPWQIYCFVVFPTEAAHEFAASAKHFNEVVEGHGGEWNYHFVNAFKEIYFYWDYAILIVLPFVIIGIWQIKSFSHKLFMGFLIGFVYLFFTLAASKMLAFTIIAMPAVVIAFVIGAKWIFDQLTIKIKSGLLKYVLGAVIVVYPAIKMFKWDWIELHHSTIHWEGAGRMDEYKEMAFIDQLKEKYDNEKIVVFNANVTMVGHIPVMFYTDYVAYHYFPEDEHIQKVLDEGYKCVVLDNENTPENLYSDERVEMFTYDYP
ncbi:glycosyltransferase family 39 protein [Paracrocinitomix mangrovi]|uniref:ArnT family glycosyltransferase n=1 Tax=Paracrocinitomix mangrovi TaxID=2862509 RepID=UPI001C8E9B70|nr:glycosyltransferase family 39 protein [Paracrocinitomix mangrovi]UKN02033.1 glycosyltransferase family 39 protein [Paracrocinitomix mangrovi]